MSHLGDIVRDPHPDREGLPLDHSSRKLSVLELDGLIQVGVQTHH